MMISALYLIPAVVIGAAAGFFLAALIISGPFVTCWLFAAAAGMV